MGCQIHFLLTFRAGYQFANTVCNQARLCQAAQCIEMHLGGYTYSHAEYRSAIKVPRFLMFLGLGWNKI